MQGKIGGLGLVAEDVLGIIGFFHDLIPAQAPKSGAVVRIKLGLAKNGDQGIGGKVGAVYAWDADNRYLGKSGGGKIDKPGDFKEFAVVQDDHGARAGYIGVSAEKDALCIAWITVRTKDETIGGSWTGDVGSKCGQHWYPATETAGYMPDGETLYIPRCTWLDEDHTGGKPSASMKFKILAYGETVADTVKTSKQCAYTEWGPDNGPINARPGKRGLKPRQKWMEDSLIVSNLTQHKAEGLCSSDTSWGPDFVGTDGMFCDMGSKKLTPLCSTRNIDGCLDIGMEGNAVTKRSSVAKRDVKIKHKSYSKITHWALPTNGGV